MPVHKTTKSTCRTKAMPKKKTVYVTRKKVTATRKPKKKVTVTRKKGY